MVYYIIIRINDTELYVERVTRSAGPTDGESFPGPEPHLLAKDALIWHDVGMLEQTLEEVRGAALADADQVKVGQAPEAAGVLPTRVLVLG